MRALVILPVLFLAGCEVSREEQAMEAVRYRALDADSVQFRNVAVLADGRVCLEANSKNAFGALAGFQPLVVDGEGQVHAVPNFQALTWDISTATFDLRAASSAVDGSTRVEELRARILETVAEAEMFRGCPDTDVLFEAVDELAAVARTVGR